MNELTLSNFENREQVLELKKLLAAKVLIEEKIDALSAAINVDQKVFEAEVVIDVENGECTEEDAVEKLIDRKTSQLSMWFNENGAEIVEKAFEVSGSAVGALVSRIAGPKAVEVGQKVGKKLGKVVSKTATVLIDKGLRKVSSFVKKAYQHVKEKIARPLVEKVKNFFGF